MSESTPPVDLSEIWGVPLAAEGCPKCGAVHLVPAGMEKQICPACHSASLTPQPTRAASQPPELCVPFGVAEAQANANLARWMGGVWLKPAGFTPGALSAHLQKTYLPMWLVDGRVAGSWQAQAGFDYQVASSKASFNNGQWRSQQVAETRIRWEPRLGGITRQYQNLAVAALEDHNRLISSLGQYDFSKASAYQKQAIEKGIVRVPELSTSNAWSFAQTQFERVSAKDCQAAAQAQHIDQFKLQAEYSELNWTQLLLPVYATYYQDDSGANVPILINGQNGTILGVRRASQRAGWRLTAGLAGLAFFCFALALILGLIAAAAPGISAFSALLLFLSLALFAGSPVPAIWAWQFNRNNPLKP